MAVASIEYERHEGGLEKMKIRSGQRILIGASHSADIRVANIERVAARHCEISFDNGECSITDLTRGRQPVSVNGASVVEAVLDSGDAINVGNNKLTLTLEFAAGSTKSAVPDRQPSRRIQPSSSELDGEIVEQEPVCHLFPNGVRTFELNDFESMVHPSIVSMDAVLDYAVIYNHSASGLESGRLEDDNLLADSPGDISRDNDLFCEVLEDKTEAIKIFREYAACDAGVLAILKKDDSAMLKQNLKLLAAWFAKPSSLSFHLVHGSDLLTEKVFDLFQMLVLPGVGSEILMVNHREVSDWGSFQRELEEWSL